MYPESKYGGVLAASITPIKPNGKPDYDAIPYYLDFLAQRGCHGALILGTTGEGPSFSVLERKQIYRSALEIRQKHPNFILLAGTGTPSLDESIQLTRYVFNLAFDGVVVLPPYYFRKVSEEGIFAWFDIILQRAVPPSRKLYYYHIPQLTGISVSLDLFQQLYDHHPTKFGGLKDS
ncbi:MAG: dihydrodipicolinate synthase family protein, partial [Anaerolineales bacterium]